MNSTDFKMIMDNIHEIKKKALEDTPNQDLNIINKCAEVWRIMNWFSDAQIEKICNYYNSIDKS